MHRFLAAICAALLLMSLTACGSRTPPTHVQAGHYDVFSLQQGGKLTERSDFARQGRTIALDLREDGTGALTMDGDATDFTWADGVITARGTDIPFSVVGGMLTLDLSDDSGDYILIFQIRDSITAAAGQGANPAKGG